MIKVDFSMAIAVYLLLTIAIIACAWILFERKIKSKNIFKNWQKRHVWQCAVCTYTYLDKEGELSICPCCKSYNKIKPGTE
jgi:hypothetical protein